MVSSPYASKVISTNVSATLAQEGLSQRLQNLVNENNNNELFNQ